MRAKWLFLPVLIVAAPVSAESADFYRGGWRTAAGDPQVFEFASEPGLVSIEPVRKP